MSVLHGLDFKGNTAFPKPPEFVHPNELRSKEPVVAKAHMVRKEPYVPINRYFTQNVYNVM